MEPTKPTKTPVNPLAKSAAAAKRANLFAGLAIIIAVIAIVISVLIWQQTTGFHGGIQNQIRTVSQKDDTNHKMIMKTINHLTDSYKQQQKSIDTLQNNLNQVLDLSKNQNRQLALSEATYLIHLANIHLNVGHDIASAEKLLQLAYDHLKTIDDPSFFNLKAALNKDIAKLKAMSKTDMSALILKLESINTQIQNLSLLPSKFQTDSRQLLPKPLPDSDHLPWYKRFIHSLSGLKELVLIRHEDQPISPLLSEQQQLFLKENIQFKLFQTEWAVINQQQKLYTDNLQQVKNWLTQYFHQNKKVPNIISEINALIPINIKPELPSISDTLKSLHQTTAESYFSKSPSKKENPPKSSSNHHLPVHAGVAV